MHLHALTLLSEVCLISGMILTTLLNLGDIVIFGNTTPEWIGTILMYYLPFVAINVTATIFIFVKAWYASNDSIYTPAAHT